MIRKAMILAAGFGKRVQPLTLDCPKPLLKIGNETLLFKTITLLEKFGINEVVINIHHLGGQIIDYINKSKFSLKVKIVEEKNKILDTGGGVLNAIHYFDDKPFFIINPDTVWSLNYLKELQVMEKIFFENKKNKCLLLLVSKSMSFDKSFSGDFNLENNIIQRSAKTNLKYIFAGLQIIKPEVFNNIDRGIFSINKIWDNLIQHQELYGMKSSIDFFHVSTLNIYKELQTKFKH